MKFTDYIELVSMETWSRNTLERKHIELLKKYHELEESTVEKIDFYLYTFISLLLGMCLSIILYELGGLF